MADPGMVTMPVIVILLAGRPPERDSPRLPPALQLLDGTELVVIAAQELRSVTSLSGTDLVVLAPTGFVTEVRTALSGVDDRVTVLDGASTQHESVHIALRHLHSVDQDDDAIVLIHDACRPLTSASQIDRVLAECVRRDGRPVIPVQAMTESVKVLDERGQIVRSVIRESVVRVQMPQAGLLSKVREMHAHCADERRPESAILVATGPDSQLVSGDELGMPVLTSADRRLATVLRLQALLP